MAIGFQSGGTSGGPSRGWLIVGRVKAAMLVVTCLLAMLSTLLLHPIFKSILANQGMKPTGFGEFYLAYPWLGIVLGIPALASCIPLVLGTRRTMLWMSISSVLLMAPFGYLLAAFLSVVGPLYSQQLP
jgi:hypothetical protein